MPVALPQTHYTCIDPAAATAMRNWLTDAEQLGGVTATDQVVMVSGMDLVGAIQIAELGVERGWMEDAEAAATIRQIETAPKAWV